MVCGVGTRWFLRGWHGDDPYRLTDCLLHLDNLLPWDVLDLARPVFPQPLPDQAWTVHLPHDPVRAMHEFIDGWYADVPAFPPARRTCRCRYRDRCWSFIPLPRDAMRCSAGRTSSSPLPQSIMSAGGCSSERRTRVASTC